MKLLQTLKIFLGIHSPSEEMINVVCGDKKEEICTLPIVTIICSLSQEEDIKKVRDNYINMDYLVDYPRRKDDKKFTKLAIVEDYINRIAMSDEIVAITKDDGTFGDGATYELAFAKYFGKRIRIIDKTKEVI